MTARRRIREDKQGGVERRGGTPPAADREPDAQRTGRDTFNDNDSIYRPSLLLKVTRARDGYVGCIVLNADPDHDGA
ncbi:hypothetical protein [Amycolatopsis sp. CA-128772]|uniref:hypothetical protein n=1 Tax=Amycolatopsis sp. CA-128772 TaxID=2073159 RepID=UPI001E5C59A8|nr:hypothetical protein [Amycolatopsis sp. CA-128772]